jgi:hypothetical protein
MKKLLLAFVVLLSVTMGSFAQGNSPKVIALINKASWCTVCQANGARFEKDIMPMAMANKDVQIVMNDLSDAQTKAASSPMLKKAGVASFARINNGTGTLYFIDAKSKKLISEVSLAKSDEEIKKVYMAAIAKG